MPTWTPSTAAVSPQPVSQLTGTGTQVVTSNLFQAGPYGNVFPCNGDAIQVRVAKIGTPTSDCTIEIWFAIDDAATQFGNALTLTNAQINGSSASGGFSARVPTAGKFWRAYLNAGTMTGGNGFALSGRA